MEYNFKNIGNRIVDERKRLKLSQEELIYLLQEKRAGISRNTLSRIENGDAASLSVNVLSAMCDIFDCELSYILCENDCTTKDIQGIHNYIGLSEDSIEFLHRQGPDMGEKRILSTLVSAYGIRIALQTLSLMVELMKYEETAPSFAGSATEKVFAENTLYRIHERSAAIDSAVSDWVDSITDRQSIIEKIKKVT